jgi:hypothetical protein
VFALVHTLFGVPAVRFYFPKQVIVYHHTGATRLMMFEVYKTSVAKFLAKPREVFGDNMGVDVYLKECVCSRLHGLCVFDGVKIAVFGQIIKHFFKKM